MSPGEMHEVISLLTPAPGQPDPVSGQWRREEAKGERKRLEDTHPTEMGCSDSRKQN